MSSAVHARAATVVSTLRDPMDCSPPDSSVHRIAHLARLKVRTARPKDASLPRVTLMVTILDDRPWFTGVELIPGILEFQG